MYNSLNRQHFKNLIMTIIYHWLECRDRQQKTKCMERIAQPLKINAADIEVITHNHWCPIHGELIKKKNNKSKAGAD